MAPCGRNQAGRAWSLAALVIAFALAACGGGGGSNAASPTGSAGSARVAAARRALCRDLVQIGGGAFRPDNLGRLLPKLKTDLHLLEAAGDRDLATSVRRLEQAIVKLRAALQGHGSLQRANHGMLQAVASMPNC